MQPQNSSQRFFAHYTRLRTRILFRWVDARKGTLLKRAISERRGLRILDLGCGTGRLVQGHVSEHYVCGIDHDLEMLTLAKSRGLLVCQASFLPLPLAPSSCDVVFMVDSLEHARSRERTVAEIRRILRDDGIFIAITPNYSSCLWLIGEKFANFVAGTPNSGHITPFTRESIHFFISQNFVPIQTGRLNLGMWLYAIGRKASRIT